MQQHRLAVTVDDNTKEITCVLGIDVCNMEGTETVYDNEIQKYREVFYRWTPRRGAEFIFGAHRLVVPLALQSRVIRNTLYIKLSYEFKHKWYA
jgi:hypothetical protein